MHAPILFEPHEIQQARAVLESDHLFFVRWAMRTREYTKMEVNPYHQVIASAIDKVFTGEITRLIITVPPGYGKTEMVSLGVVARGLAVNPRSRHLMVSYSDKLVLDNSRKVRTLINTPQYQQMWPVTLMKDASEKRLWVTRESGQLAVASTKGQITGFRAGTMDTSPDGSFLYTGALLIDDMLKPADAFHPLLRQNTNTLITNTLMSRLMHNRIPVIVIMQRLHMQDPVNYLLQGGTGDTWTHVDLPVHYERCDYSYPVSYTHGKLFEHALPDGMLWPNKHSLDDLPKLQADRYTYNSQYKQRPSQPGSAIFDTSKFQFYTELPHGIIQVAIFADTAQKTDEIHDYTVFQCWAVAKRPGEATELYLMDQWRGKWDAVTLQDKAQAFWEKHRRKHGMNRVGATAFYIEDKSSGTGLIQQLKAPSINKKAVPVVAISRGAETKAQRHLACVIPIDEGRVYLPMGNVKDANNGSHVTNSEFVPTLLEEIEEITVDMSQTHDDQVDPMSDAIYTYLIGEKADLYGNL